MPNFKIYDVPEYYHDKVYFDNVSKVGNGHSQKLCWSKKYWPFLILKNIRTNFQSARIIGEWFRVISKNFIENLTKFCPNFISTHENNAGSSCYKKKTANSSSGDNIIFMKFVWFTFFNEHFSNGRSLLSNKWILDSSYSLLPQVLSVMILALKYSKYEQRKVICFFLLVEGRW